MVDLVFSFHVLLWLEILVEGMAALLWVSISKIALLLSLDLSTGDGFISESEGERWNQGKINFRRLVKMEVVEDINECFFKKN